MTKNLVIVESPAKAKTIEKFLGKDFTVKSCYGHIRDLAKGDEAIDINNNFNPTYEVSDDKKTVVADLKKLSKSAEIVWLASDEDREGEAISWHLSEVLQLEATKTRRIVFHEITKPAILKAIENPRKIDKHLVDAQQARRVLDRLVGFELSPVLWRKVKSNLSAGRVQSVAVRLIVEREREINVFTSTSTFKVSAIFMVGNKTFTADLDQRFNDEASAHAFLESCKQAKFNISNLEVKAAEKSPAPPFTTSTLQQEASRKLGYGVSVTMSIAQKLYENGHITYMRTDSVNLSELAIHSASKTIKSQFGETYSSPRKYTTKNQSAQEAHEAIRPTYFENNQIEGTPQEKRLYELIWKRALASQMSKAQLERTIVSIDISGHKQTFTAVGEVLKFDGFLKLYLESSDDEDESTSGLLPPMKVNDTLTLQQMDANEKYSKPAARYTEASLVKKLEELGIGRPSTYAPTISTIQKRGYVLKEDREGKERQVTSIQLDKNGAIKREVKTERFGSEKAKLFPSDIGMVVTDFLQKHFEVIMDYGFTASVEEEFDKIAEGQLQWNNMIHKFYGPFHSDVTRTTETAERQKGERTLGIDPESGKNIYVKVGRFGAYAQIGENDDDPKPRFASLRSGQLLETITLEEAIDLFRLPRLVGEFEGKEIKASIGRFGPYLIHDSKFVSIPKTDDVYAIDSVRAIELIEQKRITESQKLIKTFVEDDSIKVLNGRWGPYISRGKDNFKIPKTTVAAELNYADVIKLIESQGGKKEESKVPTKKVAKKVAAKSSVPAKKASKKIAKKASKK